MRLSLLALLFALTPAFAAGPIPPLPLDRPLEACPVQAASFQVAQLACCKKNKGVCGCRAGKIVCCDNTTSTEPGCTCHGDEPIVE